MTTIPQTTFSAQHTLTLDAALRDARAQLPRTADAARADRGLVLALNGAVTLHSTTEAHVTSGSDTEIVYHVHARGGCDCPDGHRRLEAMPDVAPGQRYCKHAYACLLVAMAHIELHAKGYTPEAEEVWFPAVSVEEWAYGVGGWAELQANGSYWFEPRDERPGWYTDSLSLELWDKTPCHVTAWYGQVTQWSRWLQG